MKIEIIDEIGNEDSRALGELLTRVAACAGRDELSREDWEVCLTLTDGARIRALNREFRQVDSETDVLSFPLWDRRAGEEATRNPETNAILLGDIVISLPRAEEQAREYGHSLRREAAYLCVHGMLHLMGYDHMNDGERAVMRAREEELLTALNLTRED